jgi:hypothetical protein
MGSNGSRGRGHQQQQHGGMVPTTLTDRLGNEIAGYLQEQNTTTTLPPPPPPPAKRKKGFFGFLHFTPHSSSSSSSKKHKHKQRGGGGGGVTVEEFHQRNQEFLQQSEYARSKQKALRDNSPHRQYVNNECVYCSAVVQ